MCGIEPSNLAVELLELKIGPDAVEWYQAELDRYSERVETAAELSLSAMKYHSVCALFCFIKCSIKFLY